MNLNSWQLYSFNVVTVRLLPQLIYLCAVRQGNKMVHWIIGSMHSTVSEPFTEVWSVPLYKYIQYLEKYFIAM